MLESARIMVHIWSWWSDRRSGCEFDRISMSADMWRCRFVGLIAMRSADEAKQALLSLNEFQKAQQYLVKGRGLERPSNHIG